MKRILFTILLSFIAFFTYSQVNYSFRGKANIYSATRGTGVDTAKWVVLAVFADDMSYYASDSLALGDYIYTTSDFGCAALRVDTINSKTGGVFNLDVTDMNNVLTSISGVSFVFTPTPNQGYPTFAQGLPAQIQACIIADLALRVDAIQGVSTGDKNDITVVNAETNWQIDAGVVGSTELATNAVTTVKITDLNVTTSKINDLAVTTGKLNDAAVTTSKITDLNITTGKIADLGVTTGKINDDAVTNTKSANMAAGTIKSNLTGSSADPADNTIAQIRTALTIEDSTSNKLVIGTLAPNKYLFATGTKTASTTLSYLNREINRIFIDSLIPIKLPGWTTAGRPSVPKNGDIGYNATLNLMDIRINGAWRNGVVSDGALTAGSLLFVDASGHASQNNSLLFWNGSSLMVGFNGTSLATLHLRGGMRVESSSGVSAFRFDNNNSTLLLGSAANGPQMFASDQSSGGGYGVSTGSSIEFKTESINSTASGQTGSFIFRTTPSSYNATAIIGGVKIIPTFTPSSGSANITGLEIRGSYAPTGTFSGALSGMKLSTNLNALAQSTYAALRIETGLGVGAVAPLTGISQLDTVTNNFLNRLTIGLNASSGATGLDVYGRVRIRNLSSGTSVGFMGYTSNGTQRSMAFDPTTLSISGNTVSVIGGAGASTRQVKQTAHGFTAGDGVFWNTTAWKAVAGVAGDTIRFDALVTVVYSVDSFRVQYNGVFPSTFSRSQGEYFANTTGGLSLTQDPDARIVAIRVESGHTIINPVHEDLVQALSGEIMTLENSEGSRPFEVGETLTMHYDSLIGQSYGALFSPTDTIVMTGANYYTVGDWNTAELATSDWTKRDTALVYTGNNGVVFKVSADVCYRVWPDNIATDKTYELRIMTGSGVSSMSRRYKDVPDDGHTDCTTLTALYTGNNSGSNALLRVSIGNMPGEVKFLGGSLTVERL